MEEKYLCCGCNTDKGVKIRDDGSSFSLNMLEQRKKYHNEKLICSDCGSNKAKRRCISTGIGKNDFLADILCDDCFVEMFYEFAN